MMNDEIRPVLRRIIARYGRAVCDDPRRCEALLRDFGHPYRREVNVLTGALREGVPRDLLALATTMPADALAARLARKLEADLALSDGAARWAVETWAWALDAPPEAMEPMAGGNGTGAESDGDPLLLRLAPGITMEMVCVPAGEFRMGADPMDQSTPFAEQPQHTVWLSAYQIGWRPVTNAQYAIYARTRGLNWSAPEDKADHPAVGMSWFEAVAFCEWASQMTGRRVALPTEAQWEKAARGSSAPSAQARAYPWGDVAPDARRCNFDGHESGTTAVGQFSPWGDSPYGCQDMAGNVWEYCADWYSESEYERRTRMRPDVIVDPAGPDAGKFRVARGGSWSSHASYLRVSYRYRRDPNDRGSLHGFRCVCM